MPADSTPTPSVPDIINYDELVRDNIGWMLALARRLCGSHEAEDAVQDAFISALRGLSGFDQRSSTKTWLHRITVNACLMRLRRRRRLAEQPIDDTLPEFDQNQCRIEAPWSQLLSLDEITHNEGLRSIVRQNIEQLPDNYRAILVLRDIEGYTTEQTAKVLALSESNVKVRLHRARQTLKARLEPLLKGELI